MNAYEIAKKKYLDLGIDVEAAMEKLKNGTVEQILSDKELWGEDLSRLAKEVNAYANSSER